MRSMGSRRPEKCTTRRSGFKARFECAGEECETRRGASEGSEKDEVGHQEYSGESCQEEDYEDSGQHRGRRRRRLSSREAGKTAETLVGGPGKGGRDWSPLVLSPPDGVGWRQALETAPGLEARPDGGAGGDPGISASPGDKVGSATDL